MAAAEAPEASAVESGDSPEQPAAGGKGPRHSKPQPQTLRMGAAPWAEVSGRGRGGKGKGRDGKGREGKGKGRDGRPWGPEVARAASAPGPAAEAAVPEAEPEVDPEGMRLFVGEWMDNLGHRIVVVPATRGGKSDAAGRHKGKGGKKGKNDDSTVGRGFLASMQKPGMPAKYFTIANDRNENREWICGNGTLVPDECNDQQLVWLTRDGRKSYWTPMPPAGPVYYDPLPMQQDTVYFDPLPGQGGGWLGQAPQAAAEAPYDATGEPTPAEAFKEGGKAAARPGAGEAAAAAAESHGWNTAAPPFELPSVAANAEPLLGGTSAASSSSCRPTPELRAKAKASPMLRPNSRTSPMLMPVAWPMGRTPSESPQLRPVSAPDWGHLAGAAARPEPPIAAISIALARESPDVCTSGPRLEWTLPCTWGMLRDYPCDFCETSPRFGIPQATNMQLAFYPNGTRTTEPGHCTVQLTRGPDSAGIKFEFLVNGRSVGPKVCTGRRYLGDFPLPFENTPEHADKRVVVTMQVMDVLST